MAASLLVLTDFRQPAHRALDYATNLATALAAPLVVLHVRRTAAFDAERFTGRITPRSAEATALALSSLTDQLTVPAVAEVQEGPVVEAVAKALAQHRPALLVLGRPDNEVLPDELVSTTALELLRAAPCPMVVVPPQSSLTLPRRVLVALDAESFSLGGHARFIQYFLAQLPSQLTVLHVSPAPAAAGAAAAAEALKQAGITGAAAPQLRPLVRPEVAASIVEQAATGEFDLVVVVARPRTFLGRWFHRSVTAHVLLHSPVPVLVLPAE
ncbi:universal stress protein [Hymenobacter cellulosivorans]|uniref:Universal stress protein n=1 Tax=Hymenobacter cellulosivorans TaxID=2932249 RepID=A0ABY4F3U5_9BACT|nr:universal stress protein [Hymenobacter cellulosivorans]UOQ51154.1 universal stress protein [Hymenobacter cellulosivorans]